ncbi:nuclear transport factor 2 family protein [Streptomyces sp. 8L]|uniref:nuclear transport factor 2 family protein n=1 Tax=Streptomyces sp. 8L TaxID=2877242 RepID=UPI001CD81AEA|nr:nuclear transport factor 2 family protein [Streptomyces sp. 8L]MCA1219949.1 nuclear transport factor 2 family protein [Streptomyces sp. 8L]
MTVARDETRPPDGAPAAAAGARRAKVAAESAARLFEAYRRHDIDAMTDLCTDTARFSYVPYEVWGKQRVLRGDGKVKTVGKTIWAGLVNSFPDLHNVVHTIDAGEDGDAVVSCDIGGRQQLAWGAAEARGGSFSEPHLFVLHVDEDGLIDSVRAYWDGAGINRQLGHLEVD